MTKTLVATPDPIPPLVWSIEQCPRCDTADGHADLAFEKLEKQSKQIGPAGEDRMIAYWAPCPVNGQPILLSIVVPKFYAGETK